MKLRKNLVIIAVCIVMIAAFFYVTASKNAIEPTAVAAETPAESPLSSRFLNMLNHNFVYGNDFNSFDTVVQGAVLSTLSSREGDYIPESVVKGFVEDMYGLTIASFGESPAFHKEGYVYIIPRGFTRFTHENISVSANEDGTYTVLTDVTVDAHDSEPYKTSAVSLFAPSNDSPFGFILVYSNLAEDTLSF